MNFKYFIYLWIFISFGSKLALASENSHTDHDDETHKHGTHLECPLPNSTNDIIACALNFHPSVKKQSFNIDIAKSELTKAAEIPNPEITSRYVQGEQNGDTLSTLEANLAFTLELGGKRDARKGYAKSKQDITHVNLKIMQDNIKINTISNLYRLRQVLEEKVLIEETLLAFKKVIKQLKNRSRLSAEQEASLILFELAYEESKINKSELFEEEKKLEHYFHIATGHSLNEILEYLPKQKVAWPKISKKYNGSESNSIKKLRVISQLAHKKYEIKDSQAWPNLKIGPSITVNKTDTEDITKVGFNVSFPIPALNRNQGGKAIARGRLNKAKKIIQLTKSEENHERFEMRKVYESSVNILKLTTKSKQVEAKQKRIQNLYLRGIVSTSVFLESLKQKLSYLRSRNQRELTAINALWSVYMFDGKVNEVKL